jgi:hypothetical protein
MQSELRNTSEEKQQRPSGFEPKACFAEFLILLEGQKK